MSLPHAILTALLEKPSSGLELTRRFDKSIRYFWSATHQQIYRELGRLEKDGLIRAVPQPPSRGRRKEYEVLPEGRTALAAWITEPQDPKPARDPLLLRLRAAAATGTGGALAGELRRHLDLHRAQLEEYRAIELRDFPPGRTDEASRLHHVVLQAGLGLETHWIDWLEAALAALPGPGGTAPDRPAPAPGGP
ncbi:PadR family transcriptional regulator [Kitasatospora sp. NE20-6]|uniref:PadR family transcriptional regulator n=1 Tax=Kitasatospora sp. NE20-6 TaxID=2859066 RepID=UPI0034DCB72D